MKTKIVITGQKESNIVLLNAINCGDMNVVKRRYGGYDIEYGTKEDAVKELSRARIEMKSKEPYNEQIKYKRGEWLCYESSCAEIVEINIGGKRI